MDHSKDHSVWISDQNTKLIQFIILVFWVLCFLIHHHFFALHSCFDVAVVVKVQYQCQIYKKQLQRIIQSLQFPCFLIMDRQMYWPLWTIDHSLPVQTAYMGHFP